MNPSSVWHPHTNGQVESSNKNILESLKKRLDDAKGLWVKKLPSTLWAIRQTMHSRIRDIPFNLTFGADAVIPVKIGINSLRVAYCNPKQNEANLRANLDILEEIREEASMKAATRQMKVTTISTSESRQGHLKKGIWF